MDTNKEELQSNDEFLKQYLNDTSMGNTTKPKVIFQQPTQEDLKQKATNLDFYHFDSNITPLGKFYPNGTKIMVRPCTVKEVQAYSMVDDNNPYDIVEKMNDMIQSCVRVKYRTDEIASYLDIKDGDRFYLIFLIRELTFQAGNTLAAPASCTCGREHNIELKRQYFRFHDMDDTLSPYFDDNKRKFVFDLINGDRFEVGIPNIGLQKSFTEYIIKEYREKKKTPDMAFLKIMPFLMSDYKSVDEKIIKDKLNEFQSLSEDSFLFINDAISKLKFGIKDVMVRCECGEEVHTDNIFPFGAAGVFVTPGAFERFIKK